jgi:hypothetical protein
MGETDDYTRGHTDGQITARLAQHDKHFESINVSIEALGHEVHDLGLAVQRLTQMEENRDKTLLKTATVLKEVDDNRRQEIEDRWLPWAKVLAVLIALSALVSIYSAFRH